MYMYLQVSNNNSLTAILPQHKLLVLQPNKSTMDMEPLTLRELNPFEQQPNLYKLYTQLCYIFPIQDETAHAQIESTLQTGLQRLANAFPWLAGQVVLEGAGNGSSGTYSVKALDKSPRLVIKDLRNDPSAPTLDGLRAAEFPVSMLDEDLIAPCKTLEMAFGSPEEAARVLVLQVNYIVGGLLLTIATQHNVMDMTGQAEITRLLSKACRGEAFTTQELEVGNTSSAGVIKLLDDSVDALRNEISHVLAKPPPPPPASSTPPSPPPESTWLTLTFPSTALATLKTTASASKPPTAPFISTDDALTALIWQATIRARLPRLQPDHPITLARALDPRRHLPELPATYPGLVQNMAFSTSTAQELTTQPLGVIASLLRSAVDPQTSNLERGTRAFASLLAQSDDKGSINVTASLDLSADIMLSSWAAVACYEGDFGFELGAPEMVRRPGFTAVESLMYLLPKTRAGDVSAMVCLRREDGEALRRDGELGRFGRIVG